MSTLIICACGATIPAGEEFCPECGTKVVAGPLPGAGSPTTGAPARPLAGVANAVVACASCGVTVPGGEEFCLECGTKVASTGSAPIAAAPAAPAVLACAKCGSTIPNGEEFCPNCGATAKLSPPSAPAAPPASRKCPNPDCGLEATGRQRFCRRCGTRLPDPPPEAASPEGGPALAAGALVAEKYRIQKVLAEGGMGFLYLAEDVLLQRTVVLKTALRQNDAELIRQQADEYRYLAAIKHPNIVGIYEVTQLLGVPAIVMEFVKGQTIAKQIEGQNAPLAPGEAVRYILQILPAFSYLHRFEGGGLVYQDFKLQNMMREQLKDGSYRVVLIDLGTVVRANDPGAPLWGTRGYYPPELEAQGTRIIPQPETDLYTIGRALLEMVTGMDVESPLFGLPPATEYEVLTQHPALYRFLERACHSDPGARFQTAEAMTEQLKGVLRQIEGGVADEPFPSGRFVNPDYVIQGTYGPRAATMLDRQDAAYPLLRDGDVAVRLGSTAQAWEKYALAARQNGQSGQALLRLLDLFLESGARSLRSVPDGLSTMMLRTGTTAGLPTSPQTLQAAAALLAPEEAWQLRWYGAKVAAEAGKLAESERLIRELMAELPGEIAPQVELARLLRLQGRPEEAFATAARMAAADPANGLAIAELAAALRRLTDADAAGTGTKGRTRGLTVAHLTAALPVLVLLQSKTDFPPLYLLQGDLYRAAAALAGSGALQPKVVAQWPGVPSPSAHAFALAAEAGYQEYLKRATTIPPSEREEIVRIKFAAAPWRWL